ncbi:MAG: hypothetical protein KZQ57_04085, partial [gamma proteobacterium symbiont of Lucinoma myriamae]|nr:hypothetical protein [gamma proteobacterium symbiont of Lucinoma myriamae]
MYENLALLAAFTFLYSILAGGLERTPINGAVVFTAFGVLVYARHGHKLIGCKSPVGGSPLCKLYPTILA